MKLLLLYAHVMLIFNAIVVIVVVTVVYTRYRLIVFLKILEVIVVT